MTLIPIFVSDQSFLIGSLPISETWNVPDLANSMDGINIWTPYIGSNAWGVVSNALQLQSGDSSTHGGRLNTNLGTSDYQVSMDLVEFHDAGFSSSIIVAGLIARAQGDASLTFYTMIVLGSSGTYTLGLNKWVAGSVSPIGSVSIVPVNGMHLLFRTVNVASTVHLQCVASGVTRIDTFDTISPILSGPYVGLQGVTTTGNRVRVDNFLVATPTTRRASRGLSPMASLAGVR